MAGVRRQICFPVRKLKNSIISEITTDVADFANVRIGED
jgi:hypothetical protein